MNAKELRIGNFVQYDSQLRGWTLDKVHPEYFIEGALKNVKPVLLTIAWIISFGFKDTTNTWGGSTGADYHFQLGLFEIQTYDSDDNWHLKGQFDAKFKYVHQLQNLYFALTQAELVRNEA